MIVAVDLILVLIVLVCALIGYQKGFVLSCFNFFGGLISFILDAFLAEPLGAYISTSFLQPLLQNYFTKAFGKFLAKRAAESNDSEVLSAATDFFHKLGLEESAVQNYFEQAEYDVETFIHSAVTAVTQPIAKTVGFVVALVLLFVVLFFVCKFIFRFFDFVAKLPVLNVVNRSLGLLFGISYGILLAVVFSVALEMLEPFIQRSDLPFLSDFSIERTYLAKFLSVVLKDFF